MAYVNNTELDALLDRVREDKRNNGKDRLTVAFDCWRMFENLAERYKEECEMRDRYKRQASSRLQRMLRMHEILREVDAIDDGDDPGLWKYDALFKRVRAEVNHEQPDTDS